MLIERILMAIVLLEIPLQFDKYFGHNEALGAVGAVSGFNISLTTLCLPLLYALWLPRFLRASMFPGTGLRINTPLLIYVGLTGLSLIVAHNRWLALNALWLMLQTLLIYIYVANATRTRQDVSFVVALLLCGVAIHGCLMAATRLLGDIQLGPFITATIDPITARACGTMGSPNTVAGYLQLLLPLSVAVWFGSVAKWQKLLAFVAFVCGMVGLVLTLSRGGWLGTAVSLGLLLVIGARRGLIPLMSIVRAAKIPILGLLIMMVCLSPMIVGRLTSDDGGAASSRLPLNMLSLRMIAKHPLGVGANNNAHVAQKYTGTADMRGEWFYTVHNKYLLVWSEIGFFGLLAFIAFLVTTVRCGWQASKRMDHTMSIILLSLTVGVAGQMVHMLVDIFNCRAHEQVLWVYASLILAISALHSTQNRRETEHPLPKVA